jgi:hypothetical protein
MVCISLDDEQDQQDLEFSALLDLDRHLVSLFQEQASFKVYTACDLVGAVALRWWSATAFHRFSGQSWVLPGPFPLRALTKRQTTIPL